jgi:hypothetical protein
LIFELLLLPLLLSLIYPFALPLAKVINLAGFWATNSLIFTFQNWKIIKHKKIPISRCFLVIFEMRFLESKRGENDCQKLLKLTLFVFGATIKQIN